MSIFVFFRAGSRRRVNVAGQDRNGDHDATVHFIRDSDAGHHQRTGRGDRTDDDEVDTRETGADRPPACCVHLEGKELTPEC